MGNIWSRKSSSSGAHEAEDEGPSRSIEMKGTQALAAAAITSSSLSSWPLCLDERPNSSNSQTIEGGVSSQVRGSIRLLPDGNKSAGPSSLSAASTDGCSTNQQAVCCWDSDRASGASPRDDEAYHEVQVTLRIPCTPTHDAPGENLQQELCSKERQRQVALKALDVKTQECESLLKVVRELTASRNKLTSMKSIQAERFADLQHDFMRVSRVADLSRALSRENIAKSTHLGQCLNQVEEELARQRLTSQQFKEQCLRLKIENSNLKEKLSLINRMDLVTFRRESACLVEYQQLHLKETY